MRSTGIIYMATQAQSKLTDELMLAGFRVWEALSESEVHYLCETEDVDAVIIAADVASSVVDLQRKYITLKLEPEAKAVDLVWELSILFPGAFSLQ